jgi:hypothetical protein
MALLGRPSREDDQRAEAWGRWIRQRNPLAIASVVLGIFSLIEFGALLIFGVAGTILGVMALRQLSAGQTGEGSPLLGRRLAWTGIALSVVSLLIGVVLLSRRHAF